MLDSTRRIALEKLAYFGPAYVAGAPSFYTPPLTVGQVMYNINNPASPLSQSDRRLLTNKIVQTNTNVNSPAKSLLRAGIGALAGNFIATTLGAGPFTRGMATAIGANYGYRN